MTMPRVTETVPDSIRDEQLETTWLEKVKRTAKVLAQAETFALLSTRGSWDDGTAVGNEIVRLYDAELSRRVTGEVI